ncbi:hypothetical protein DV20_21540 [Amycolatopsis rifamycinica]|uniref:HIT domain-containing protein n=2 Tax=Amycolatopsis rifamycinica TaxID=287986 RepID=A0A066TZF7_9PSEU|nr:hypothetical protein DV20_21540 [Amycolatopsis rifamycinica]
MHRDDCFICRALHDREPPWTDQPLLLQPGRGCVLPGVGALVAGYVLICPADHVPNLCAASPESGFADFLRQALACLSDRLGELTYWEHGGVPTPSFPTSACVDHAHLHVVPGSYGLQLPAPAAAHSSDAPTMLLEHSDGWRERPYLMLGSTGSTCALVEDVGIPQYFRRRLATAIGQPDLWDYAAFPGEANVRATLALFHDFANQAAG